MSWKLVHCGTSRESVLIGGANVWEHPWKTQGEVPVRVNYPASSENEVFLPRYFIEPNGKAHEFAAELIAPGHWLIAVQDTELQYTLLLRAASYLLGTFGTFIALHGLNSSLKYTALGLSVLALALFIEKGRKSLQKNDEA